MNRLKKNCVLVFILVKLALHKELKSCLFAVGVIGNIKCIFLFYINKYIQNKAIESFC